MATDFKIKYGTPTALTIDLASLASDTNLLAGRESTAVDNTSDLFADVLVAGKIRVGTTPTVGRVIEVWAYAALNPTTPTYPDVLDGTDSNETMTHLDIKYSSLRLVAAIAVNANTTDRDYFVAPTSLAALFGSMPAKWGIFVVHNTAVALNATGGNHVLTYQGISYQIP